MLKKNLLICLVFTVFIVKAQEPNLPTDFRQHNLTQFNSSLLSPVFSLDRNDPQSVALWTRWQWQSIDADPTTVFFNYTRKLNNESAIGAGFIQNNTGVFVNTGGILNYAYNFELNSSTFIAVGVNLIGYQRELADPFNQNPDFDFPQFEERNSFILQLAPAVRLQYNTLSFGIAMENIVDYNFTEEEGLASTTGKIYTLLGSYDIPLGTLDNPMTSYIRPSIYYRRLPEFKNQLGFNGYYSHPKYWGQLGFNSFYGISAGAGGRFFEKFSFGALIEFGTGGELKGEDPTIELVTAFSFGAQEFKSEEVPEEEPAAVDELEEIEQKEEQERIAAELALQEAERKQDSIAARESELLANRMRQERANDSIAKANKDAQLAIEQLREQKRKDSIKTIQQELLAAQILQKEERRQDSINAVKKAEALAEAQKMEERRQDSINKALEEQQLAETPEPITPEKGEKYEEVKTEDGLAPGFYLIANVFGTKTYYNAFMKKLTDQGLNPQSFYRTKNKYNYVYLKRYDSMEEARKARDSKYGGKYPDKTWIFRVIGE
ncbi:PorP/SprF family type IX secretion system membrane protein [Eudoraea chungangensis]|uniref:PorP/SprF family type IX secretion system membrane protein n=1 Tax=Eudoraea chungangensis TaxID=1481905 RepID=UPI0023EB6B83|nr:PorP/SprF family type IX secretion system membrane protein [Eudoraea chungangensis]